MFQHGNIEQLGVAGPRCCNVNNHLLSSTVPLPALYEIMCMPMGS